MIPHWKARKWLIGPLLFAFSSLYLYWLAGDVLHLFGDEGIYLQGGRLVALGRQPYRDFFAITGPLSFWIEGLLAFCSGASLAVMRLPLVLDAAFLACAVYYLTSRYAGVLYSAGTAITFLAYEARIRQLNVNHRWDSAALSMGAILLAGRAERTKSPTLWVASGFLIAAAACATPSMAVVALPLLLWGGMRDRRCALAFLGGGALAAVIAAAYLQAGHALVPMIQSMRWNSVNYSQANRVPYGGLRMERFTGGSDTGWLGWVAYWFAMVPAIFPPVAILAWALYFRRKGNRVNSPEILPLLALVAALVCSTWPHWTSNALLYTLALSWSLCAVLFYRLTTSPQRRWLCVVILLVACQSLARKGIAAMDYAPRETRVGNLRAPLDESDFLAGLERWVQPGDSLFSYPYMPAVYYFLDARNPTYYPFMQPGMMTVEDQRRAIAELQAAPPRWLLYENFPPEAVLAFWPGSDPSRLTMAEINGWLHANFHLVDTVSGSWGQVAVMENK